MRIICTPNLLHFTPTLHFFILPLAENCVIIEYKNGYIFDLLLFFFIVLLSKAQVYGFFANEKVFFFIDNPRNHFFI